MGQLQMRALSVAAGIVTARYGAWQILLVFAFSTMLGQDLPDAARDAEQAACRLRRDTRDRLRRGLNHRGDLGGIQQAKDPARAADPAHRESRKR